MENTADHTGERRRRNLKILHWGAGAAGGFILLLFLLSFCLDEPLRRYMERDINRNLKGYSVRLPSLHLQLVGGSLTLKGLSVYQKGDEKDAIAHFPVLRASVHWRAILSGRLVAEFNLKQPKITINLRQLRREAANEVPLKERGWQEAVTAIYPLKIDIFTVEEGEIVYIDADAGRPLHLSRMNLNAGNIRNVRSAEKVYPSTFRLETVIFGTGRGVVEGNCNFLAKPFPGISARLKLENVPVDHIKSVAARSNLSVQGGRLDCEGEVEYSAKVKSALLKELTVHGMKLEYLHTARTAVAEKRRAAAVASAAKRLTQKSDLLVQVDRIRLAGCTLGLSTDSGKRPYRLFVSNADLILSNLANKGGKQPAEARLSGQFMGSGTATATARFRPERSVADFDLNLAIEKTRLTDMNDLLRAFGGFDVTAGSFSFYSELKIRDGKLSGYVKPFFKEMTVYDRRQDRGKSLSSQLYEMFVASGAWILENRKRGEVATRADISGKVADPHTSTWQIIVELMKNAFIKAMTPGFIR